MIGEHEGEGESDQAAGACDPAVEDVQNGPALSVSGVSGVMS